MRILSAADLIDALPYIVLTQDLPALMLRKTESPQRHVYSVRQKGEPDASLLLMPAWTAGVGGVKIVNVTPGNGARGLAAVTASYLVFNAVTGEHLALMDGGELTARRTAAVAAVAADRLAVPGARKLLVVGSGRIASELPFAYRAVRNISEVAVYSPTRINAEALARRLADNGFTARVCDDLESGVSQADIIACASLSHHPLVRGDWLRPGQHVALIGGYTPDMREADDAAMKRCRIWVDGHGALSEAGDLVGPLSHGVLRYEDILGTLADLCAVSDVVDRETTVTLFKSVGDAAQDLAAAAIAMK